jgi:hypothetical protein
MSGQANTESVGRWRPSTREGRRGLLSVFGIPIGESRWVIVARAVGAGVLAFGIGLLGEAAIIRAVHGRRSELEWLSDVIVSIGVAAISYLWLHLRVADARIITLERARVAVDEQLRLAAEIQRNLLPFVPPQTPGFRWAARMVPAGRIGGDFYDLVRHGDSVLVIVADVSGKGIPAALILSSLKTLFRTVAKETDDPAAIARRISGALQDEHGGLPYATAIVGRFDSSPARLTYVNAGHPSGLLLKDGRVASSLASTGPPLGLLSGTVYSNSTLALRPGDVGVLVTDGVTEAFEGGPTRLEDVLASSAAGADADPSPDALCDRLLRAAAQGGGPVGVTGWQDDRTAFVFAVTTLPSTSRAAPDPGPGGSFVEEGNRRVRGLSGG